MSKLCTKCKIEQPSNNFYNTSRKCKDCTKEYARLYKQKNKQIILQKRKIKYSENKEYESKKNKEKYLKNKKYYLDKSKKYREENKEKMNEYWKKYRQDERNKKRENKRVNEKYKNDINFKMSKILRSRIRKVLKNKNINKKAGTFTLIGCSISNFQKWIEYQFDNEMNWDNYGTYWNIDHVKPCSSFELNDEKQQRECFIWYNMRPMKSIENFIKYNKICENTIESHKKIYEQFLNLSSGKP